MFEVPLPLIAGAVVVGGVLISVGSGYILEMTIGDKHYSKRDLALDVGMGLIPGVGYAKPVATGLNKVRKIRKARIPLGMFTPQENAYRIAFMLQDEAIQIAWTTPLVGGMLSGMANLVERDVSKSNGSGGAKSSQPPKTSGRSARKTVKRTGKR